MARSLIAVACLLSMGISVAVEVYSDTFKIASLGATGCRVLDHDGTTGDDCGGIAISPSSVYVNGDDATVQYHLSLPADKPRYCALTSNLRTGQVYALGTSASEPMGCDGGTLSHLIQITDTTGQMDSSIALSTSITLPNNNVGIFAGWDRVVIHDSVNVSSIHLSTGTVTDLGVLQPPIHSECESFAYWGVAEFLGAEVFVVYVENSTSITRLKVSSGDLTRVQEFVDLNDMCSFSLSLSTRRWYFHHEYDSQFGGTDETLGFCDATFVAPSDGSAGFQITSLNSTNCDWIDHESLTDDDCGGIAVSSSYVFVNGDDYTGRYLLDLTEPTRVSGPNATQTPTQYCALTSNLRTGQVFSLGTNVTEAMGCSGGELTHLIHINDIDGAMSSSMALSTSITLPNHDVGIFAGFDRVVIHNTSNAYSINLSSGIVSDLGSARTPPHSECESFAYWGVAEIFGGEVHLAYVEDYYYNHTSRISRMEVSSNESTTVADFDELNDMCTFTVSPSNLRWYFHHEGDSQFGGDSETLGYCDATFDFVVVPTGAPTKAPTDAPTGSPTSPTEVPTQAPTAPTSAPTEVPTQAPTQEPTGAPTGAPTASPSEVPTAPTSAPTEAPTASPSEAPTKVPTATPSDAPTEVPTTGAPTGSPTQAPTAAPTEAPTVSPSQAPTNSTKEATSFAPLKPPTSVAMVAPLPIAMVAMGLV